MKVSQKIEAGKLTGHYYGWGDLRLDFGDDSVEFKLGESELRQLSQTLSKKIAEIEKERQEQESEDSA